MPSFRYLQSTVPAAGERGLGNRHSACPGRTFLLLGERCEDRQHQAEMIRYIRGQLWDLGSPEETLGASGGERQRRLLRGGSSSLCWLCSPMSLLGHQERDPSYQCVTHVLTASFPSKVTSYCWLFPFMSHMLSTEFSIILHVLQFYGHSILLLILLLVTVC